MKVADFIKTWIVITLTTLLLYETLWILFGDIPQGTMQMTEYIWDFVYCALFSLSSLLMTSALGRLPVFKSLKLRNQMGLCLLILIQNIILAIIAENIFNMIWPADSMKNFWRGVMMFCVIATLISFAHTTIRYCMMVVRQREELAELQKKTLRNQLNPHFMFNSLSCLAEMIHSDPDSAERYVIKLSNTYRYLLNHLDCDYATLAESVHFIRNYVQMQEVRVAGTINLEIEDLHGASDERLFSMSLQLLVENAIKHNWPSEDKTLNINIRREGNNIVVRNNKFAHSEQHESHGIGLETIMQRYRLEGLSDPLIVQDDKSFEVKIRIIKKKQSQYESTCY